MRNMTSWRTLGPEGGHGCARTRRMLRIAASSLSSSPCRSFTQLDVRTFIICAHSRPAHQSKRPSVFVQGLKYPS